MNISSLFFIIGVGFASFATVAQAGSSKGSKGSKGSKTSKGGNKCELISVELDSSGFEAASFVTATGTGLNKLSVRDPDSQEVIGSITEHVVTKKDDGDPIGVRIGNGAFISEDGAINYAFVNPNLNPGGVSIAIVGGTGIYGCASGFITETSAIGREVYICGDLCPESEVIM